MVKVSPARSYPELFRVTGSLLSLVFRTEDVWQRCNQFIETAEFLIRVSPSHSYNADTLSVSEGKIGSRPAPSIAETRMERYFTDPAKLVPGGIAKV